MKKTIPLACLAIFIAHPAFCDPLAGDNLNIGDFNTGFDLSYSSGVIGTSNSVDGWLYTSLFVGGGNQIGGSAYGNNLLIAGTGFRTNGYVDIYDSAFIGTGNSAESGYSSAENSYFGFSSSLIAGFYNSGALKSGFMAGSFNFASGQQFVLGRGLIADQTDSLQVIVGQYNGTTAPDQLFVVGNGTSSVRKNAFEILNNGKINLYGASATVPTIVLNPNTAQITVGGQPLVTATSLAAHSFSAPSYSFNNGGTNLMTINSAGNMGIGTSSPSTKLDVYGGIRTSTDANNYLTLRMIGGAPTIQAITQGGYPLTFNMSGYDVAFAPNAFGGNIYSNLTLSSSRLLGLQSSNSLSIFTNNNAIPRIFVDTAGNVGIGTTTPGSLLTVGGRIAGGVSASSVAASAIPSTASYILGNDANSGSFYIGNTNTNASVATLGFAITQTSGEQRPGARIYSSWANSINQQARLDFHVKNGGNDNNPVLSLLYNGNVGIGTTTPGAKFEVNGSVALGTGISAPTYSSTIVGSYNRAEGASGTADTDPLFTVANGTGVTSDAVDKKNHNAFVVYKDGKVNLYAKSNAATPTPPTIVLDPNTSQITVGGQPLVTTTSTSAQSFTAPSYSFNSASANRMTINSSGNMGIGTSTPSAKLQVNGNEGVMFSGTFGSGTLPTSTATANFLWYSKKAAFAGGGSVPNDEEIGNYSFAFGYGSKARGNYATAMGASVVNFGDYATAMGQSQASDPYTTALGNSTAASSYSTAMGQSMTGAFYATAMGLSYAGNDYSTAMGQSSVDAYYSTAMGNSIVSGSNSYVTAMGVSNASGWAATAMGISSASGYAATAMGQSQSTGSYATAMGQSTAAGDYATAMGSSTQAKAYASVAIGRYNVGAVSTSNGDTTWVATDPLLEVGNGTDSAHPSNALTVYKNGDVAMTGKVRMPKQGDILMGEFGNPGSGD